MDAVKAAHNIDHTESIAYDESMQAEFDLDVLGLSNAMIHLDGAVEPEMVDEYDLAPPELEEELKEEFSDTLLTKEQFPFLSESELAELRELSADHTLTDEQVEAMLEIISELRTDEDYYAGGRQLADEMPHVACTAVAACAAVVVVAVAAGAVAAAAVGAVTKVAVEDVT